MPLKPKDMLVAYMTHIEKGNAFIKDAMERLKMPLKTGLLGKTPAAIPNNNNTKKGKLKLCFGSFNQAVSAMMTEYQFLKAVVDSDKSEITKKIMTSFLKFSEAYKKVFATLLSFKHSDKEDCGKFVRVIKLANEKELQDFYNDLVVAHGVIKRNTGDLEDTQVKEVIDYMKSVVALEAIAEMPQPPSGGGTRKRRRTRRKTLRKRRV
jgi:hypothetical protein